MIDEDIKFNSDNVIFEIVKRISGIDYKYLITTKKNTFLSNKAPMQINGEFYFGNCRLHLVSGEDIKAEYIGGDVIGIEIKRDDITSKILSRI